MKEKDSRLDRQATKLKAFGDLKLRSDQIHQKEYKKQQDTIHSLKKQVEKLQGVSGNVMEYGTGAAKYGYNATTNLLQSVPKLPIPLRKGRSKQYENSEQYSERSSKGHGNKSFW